MLTDVAVVGGLMGVVVVLLEVSHRLDTAPPPDVTPESALRQAMRGPEGNAVRAEYRRRGVEPRATPRPPAGFSW